MQSDKSYAKGGPASWPGTGKASSLNVLSPHLKDKDSCMFFTSLSSPIASPTISGRTCTWVSFQEAIPSNLQYKFALTLYIF